MAPPAARNTLHRTEARIIYSGDTRNCDCSATAASQGAPVYSIVGSRTNQREGVMNLVSSLVFLVRSMLNGNIASSLVHDDLVML